MGPSGEILFQNSLQYRSSYFKKCCAFLSLHLHWGLGFFSSWNISNLHSNKCEKTLRFKSWCWFCNKSIETFLKGNFFTYLISSSVTALQWWLYQFLNCDLYPHIHWKNLFFCCIFLSHCFYLLIIIYNL